MKATDKFLTLYQQSIRDIEQETKVIQSDTNLHYGSMHPFLFIYTVPDKRTAFTSELSYR
jgi:hypothetical protein